jgi:hypothetical protein
MQMLRIKWNAVGSAAESAMAALSRLPFNWRSISALVLGVLLAKWFWILFAPHATFTSVKTEMTSSPEAGRLFGTVATTTEVSTQGVALPNVQLLGVFTASAKRPGFAILKLDDKRQKGVAEGEEVASGTKLVAVFADYVLLEKGGVQQRVDLENKYAGSPNKGIVPAYGAAAHNKQIDSAMKQVDDAMHNALPNRQRQPHR